MTPQHQSPLDNLQVAAPCRAKWERMAAVDETGAVRRHINLFVNSDHMRDRDGLGTALVPGDEVFILLTLMDEKDRLPVAGKVIWITPAGAQGNRTAGIGVQFNESADGETARTKIESLLAGIMNADRPTHTM